MIILLTAHDVDKYKGLFYRMSLFCPNQLFFNIFFRKEMN
jgi:hypothetical protein